MPSRASLERRCATCSFGCALFFSSALPLDDGGTPRPTGHLGLYQGSQIRRLALVGGGHSVSNPRKTACAGGSESVASKGTLRQLWFHHRFNVLVAAALFAASHVFVEVIGRFSAHELGAAYSTIVSACHWDCGWYLSIVDEGYYLEPKQHPKGDAANWAFFPAFPLVAKGLSLLTASQPALALVLTSKLFLFLALIAFLALVEAELGAEYRLAAGLTLAFSPYVMYAHAGYTESLYFLATALAFLFLKKERWVLAGAAGGLLSATRLVGVLFVLSYLVARLGRNWRATTSERTAFTLGLMLAPLGLALFMAYLHFRVGDALAFKHAQVAWGRLIGNPLEVLVRGFDTGGWDRYFAVLAALGLAMSLWHLARRRMSYAVFLAVVILIPLATGIQGIPRYLFWQVPFLLGIVELLGRRRLLFSLYLAFSAAFSSLFIVSWLTGRTFVI